MLSGQKRCTVVGLDLSLRMLGFARKSSRFPEVAFGHGDATDLGIFADRSFDFATMPMVMHELPRSQQSASQKEALSAAGKSIIIDAFAPLPMSAGGIGIRVVEETFGRDHLGNFRSFLAGGGIRGLLAGSCLPIRVEHAAVFWRNCREVVVVSAQR
jgi:hypothetical protein